MIRSSMSSIPAGEWERIFGKAGPVKWTASVVECSGLGSSEGYRTVTARTSKEARRKIEKQIRKEGSSYVHVGKPWRAK